ncbi:MAG TPA: hypothetical protein VN906_00485 [Candidatus Sulfotelmatobacter sp.]|nr:hypothetical protein [Candidatus Sulfotelmatobacter sp.]
MGSQGPNQPGQVSPDGLWVWDGTRWVPSGRQGTPTRPRGSRSWIWWVAGGCAVLLVIGVAGAIWATVALVNNVQQHGGFACLPSDFPSYPGATITSENVRYTTGLPPGDSKECTMTLESSNDATTVSDFYASRLSTGDWAITSNDTATGEIRFHRVSRPQTVGVLDILGRGQQTEV